MLSQNADKVDQVIDKAGDIIDSKTQGKYANAVDKVQDAVRRLLTRATRRNN